MWIHFIGLMDDRNQTLLKKYKEVTDELKMDLAGVRTLQRKLSGMERVLAAIKAKLDALEEESEKIATTHPEEAVVI